MSNYDISIEWRNTVEPFIVSKKMEDPRKVMSLAIFIQWSGVPVAALDSETLENIYELWLNAEDDKKEYKLYTKLAEA